MPRNTTVVSTSVDFRDAVMRLARGGHRVYAQRGGHDGPVYQIIGGVGTRPVFAMDDLFDRPFPPVRMEDLADALYVASQNDEPVSLEVFNL